MKKTRKKKVRVELTWGPFDGRIMRVHENTGAIELTTASGRTYHYSVLFDERRPLRALFVT
jgi:hypothetical protein